MSHFDEVPNKGRLANSSPRQSENVKCKNRKTFQTKS